MNIFILSHEKDPVTHHLTNAAYHCDKHVIKMIAESTQMLVTAVFNTDLVQYETLKYTAPCKPLGISFQKHPCTQWVMADIRNIHYLNQLALSLVAEHLYRYPTARPHIYSLWLKRLRDALEDNGCFYNRTPIPENFAVAVKDEELRSTDCPHGTAVEIYRSYYIEDKKNFASWKRRGTPYWYSTAQEKQSV